MLRQQIQNTTVYWLFNALTMRPQNNDGRSRKAWTSVSSFSVKADLSLSGPPLAGSEVTAETIEPELQCVCVCVSGHSQALRLSGRSAWPVCGRVQLSWTVSWTGDKRPQRKEQTHKQGEKQHNSPVICQFCVRRWALSTSKVRKPFWGKCSQTHLFFFLFGHHFFWNEPHIFQLLSLRTNTDTQS